MTQNEYATLIYYWHGDPHPERMTELLAHLELAELGSLTQSFGQAGQVLGFETLYPDQIATWRESYPELYKRLDRILEAPKSKSEWAALYLGTWFVTHQIKCLDLILDRVADGGEQGHYASRVLSIWCEKCAPLRHALQKAKNARAAAIIINVTQ